MTAMWSCRLCPVLCRILNYPTNLKGQKRILGGDWTHRQGVARVLSGSLSLGWYTLLIMGGALYVWRQQKCGNSLYLLNFSINLNCSKIIVCNFYRNVVLWWFGDKSWGNHYLSLSEDHCSHSTGSSWIMDVQGEAGTAGLLRQSWDKWKHT